MRGAACILTLMVALAGCSDFGPPLRPYRPSDVFPESDTLWTAWFESGPGQWYLNSISNGRRQGFATWDGWTWQGSPYNKQYADTVHLKVIYDATLNGDSTWTGTVRYVYGLPDSLHDAVFVVHGVFSSVLPRFVCQVQDSTGYWIDSTSYEPGVSCTVSVSHPKLFMDTKPYKNLWRAGPPHESGVEP